MVVEVTKPVEDVVSPSHKTLPSLMPIHDDTLKDADDNRPVVEKTTIVERSDFLYNFEDLPREVVEDIIGHCDHLYPWLFVCKRAMKFAAHYLYQSSFPEYMGEEATVETFVSNAERHGASRRSIARSAMGQNEWDEMDKPRLTMLLSLAFPELADRVKFTLSLEDTPLPSFITEISNEEMGETVGATT
ncbi:Hypothetical Protein CGB_D9210W [Cryptococcus gattii WM276]|uniref:F-box domain-containing protein n=2 Tax=Cryptococcus gattii TaxID=37769 RepID=E6R511_CRYGW|nr:Hypothetical Protein CGB_D9210W [Cryptococcus gattii WM276]ADV22158.1 Hypothetical Protein CGB_D9210W [Cryptococcus gattii WM276]KIR80572.1 hypothetical protein I306_02550 [Cryptococcus gattii EJB2]KJE03510.1 hypothetical protein I311_02810 [Cryptococcus gattii NT-10]